MQMAPCGASPRGICDPIAAKRPTLEADREQFSNKLYELSTEFYNLYHFPPSFSNPLELSLRTPCFKYIYVYIFTSEPQQLPCLENRMAMEPEMTIKPSSLDLQSNALPTEQFQDRLRLAFNCTGSLCKQTIPSFVSDLY